MILARRVGSLLRAASCKFDSFRATIRSQAGLNIVHWMDAMKRTLQTFVLVMSLTVSLARPSLAAISPVRSAQRDATGVTLTLASGTLRLEICDDRTIRVAVSPTDKLPP